MSAAGPVVGQWYRHPDADKGEIFQVVDIDVADGSVEVQYFDGDIEELEREAWHSQGMQNCAPPEDWTGPYGEIDRDDLGYTDDPPPDQPGGAVQNILAGPNDTDEGSAADEIDE